MFVFSLFAAASVEFDLAAIMGRQAGKTQCDTIYARCPYESKDIIKVEKIKQEPELVLTNEDLALPTSTNNSASTLHSVNTNKTKDWALVHERELSVF